MCLHMYTVISRPDKVQSTWHKGSESHSRGAGLEGDAGHPLAVRGEGVDLHDLVRVLQDPDVHPQLGTQLQQSTLCPVAHSSEVT